MTILILWTLFHIYILLFCCKSHSNNSHYSFNTKLTLTHHISLMKLLMVAILNMFIVFMIDLLVYFFFNIDWYMFVFICDSFFISSRLMNFILFWMEKFIFDIFLIMIVILTLQFLKTWGTILLSENLSIEGGV